MKKLLDKFKKKKPKQKFDPKIRKNSENMTDKRKHRFSSALNGQNSCLNGQNNDL